MAAKPTTIDEYLATLPSDKQAALQKLRSAIQSAAPKAVEGFSYGLPAFIIDGKAVAGFAASKSSCAYYPMSGSVVAALADDLAKYETSKGSIQFPAAKPLSATLVKKLVKCRMAEIAESAAGKKKKAPAKSGSDVDELLDGIDHPLKKEIEAVRKIILGVSDSISEGVKWNSLSFRTTEWFATVNLRSTKELQLIFHLGAKVRKEAKTGVEIADPAGLAKWLAKDRCMVTLASGKDLAAKRKPFEAFVREWIKLV
jgi:uncharacterized protein YdhG (YjbR/CyaY superfamily)